MVPNYSSALISVLAASFAAVSVEATPEPRDDAITSVCKTIASSVSNASEVFYPCALSLLLEPGEHNPNLGRSHPSIHSLGGKHRPLGIIKPAGCNMLRGTWKRPGCWHHCTSFHSIIIHTSIPTNRLQLQILGNNSTPFAVSQPRSFSVSPFASILIWPSVYYRSKAEDILPTLASRPPPVSRSRCLASVV